MKTLFAAIDARYKADSSLAAATTGMYLSEAPANAKYPYIVVTLVGDTEDFDSSTFYEDVIIQFAIFDNRKSPSRITDIFELLKGVPANDTGFDFGNLIIDDYLTLAMIRNTANLLRVDNVWEYVVSYQILLEETGVGGVGHFHSNFYNLMQL